MKLFSRLGETEEFPVDAGRGTTKTKKEGCSAWNYISGSPLNADVVERNSLQPVVANQFKIYEK